jgi:hypothetical protein
MARSGRPRVQRLVSFITILLGSPQALLSRRSLLLYHASGSFRERDCRAHMLLLGIRGHPLLRLRAHADLGRARADVPGVQRASSRPDLGEGLAVALDAAHGRGDMQHRGAQTWC